MWLVQAAKVRRHACTTSTAHTVYAPPKLPMHSPELPTHACINLGIGCRVMPCMLWCPLELKDMHLNAIHCSDNFNYVFLQEGCYDPPSTICDTDPLWPHLDALALAPPAGCAQAALQEPLGHRGALSILA